MLACLCMCACVPHVCVSLRSWVGCGRQGETPGPTGIGGAVRQRQVGAGTPGTRTEVLLALAAVGARRVVLALALQTALPHRAQVGVQVALAPGERERIREAPAARWAGEGRLAQQETLEARPNPHQVSCLRESLTVGLSPPLMVLEGSAAGSRQGSSIPDADHVCLRRTAVGSQLASLATGCVLCN